MWFLFHTGSKCRKCCLTLFTAWISKIRLVSFALTSSRTECELLNEGNSDTHTKNCGKKIIQASRRTDYYRVHICGASTLQDFCAQWHDFMFLFTFSEEFTGCCHGECCSCPGYPFIFTPQTILPIDWLDALWQSVTMVGLLTVWVRFLNS